MIMSKSKSDPTIEQLLIASKFLVYHIKMYVETLLWLQQHEKPSSWDTIRNAVLESHLVHERVLINFVCYLTPKQEMDVLAVHYFSESPNDFHPPQDDVLNNQAKNIGGQLVHLTVKSTQLKSEQEWSIRETANKLVPVLEEFFSNVAESKVPNSVRVECLKHLAKLSSGEMPVTASVST